MQQAAGEEPQQRRGEENKRDEVHRRDGHDSAGGEQQQADDGCQADQCAQRGSERALVVDAAGQVDGIERPAGSETNASP